MTQSIDDRFRDVDERDSVTEWDAIAEVRRELDEDLRALDRRLGIAETCLGDRVDMLAGKVDRLIELAELQRGDLKHLSDNINRVLDRTLDLERRVDKPAADPLPRATAIRRKK